MALTRPRAYQIYDIDYKQAVRVITLTSIVLSGGAPNSVDGVSLNLNDRVLVAGQGAGAQNGIYYVTTLGSGSNGTWTRSIDTDTTGELLAGTIVMVTEGTLYQDTQWKLTTDNPIVIGTTPLTFVQNYLANSISFGGTSFSISAANANAVINVAGTSNVAVFSSSGADISGNAYVGGALVATTKSFAIQHPTKEQVILYHGCLEGPEHAVYTRGRCTDESITLPDYWKNLVDTESITVHLTPIGHCEQTKVVKITSDAVSVQGSPVVDCFYIIHARRKDVPPLALEVPGLVEDLYKNRNL
jgi:hypothetical protein